MPVPRRKVHAKPKSIFSCRVRHLPDDVAVPVFPSAAFDTVVGLLSGPEAETVMMFCNQHEISCARCLDRPHPLLRIEIRGRKNLRISSAVSPFTVQKCVGAEVQDHSELKILPCQLLRCGLEI